MPKTVTAFLPGADQLGGTLAIEIYPQAPGTILNGVGGDVLSLMSGKPNWYSASVAEAIAGTRRGVVKLDGFAIASGLINMDAAQPVLGADTISEADADVLAGIVSQGLQAIEGDVETRSTKSKKPILLTVGDDCLQADGRAIAWTLRNAAALPDFSEGWTVRLLVGPTLDAVPVIFAGVISSGSGATRTGYAEADHTTTAALTPGDGVWQLEFRTTDDSRQMVLLQGKVWIEARLTEPTEGDDE